MEAIEYITIAQMLSSALPRGHQLFYSMLQDLLVGSHNPVSPMYLMLMT
jgi:hypothetical protein